MIGRIASSLAKVPMVHHVHSPTIVDTPQRWRNWINTATERLSLVKNVHIIVVSESLKCYLLRQRISPDRIHIVRNGVPGQDQLRQRLSPKEEWLLGTVALFRPRKGVEVLLKALSQLRARDLPVHFLAVGPFETKKYESKVKQMAVQLGIADQIEWAGFKEDVNRELDRMDVFVLPSLPGEGLPMVVLEAMAAGVPVVASMVEGIPEAIRDGKDGLLVKPGSTLELAQALERIIAGDVDWQNLGRNAYNRHAESFSDRTMAEGVSQVYDQVFAQ